MGRSECWNYGDLLQADFIYDDFGRSGGLESAVNLGEKRDDRSEEKTFVPDASRIG